MKYLDSLNSSYFLHLIHTYRPGQPNLDFHSTYAFIKKIYNFYPVIMKLGQNMTGFHNHWVKIVDFLIKAYVLWKSKLGCPGL